MTTLAEGSSRYTIKRGLKQQPVLLTPDGRTISTVDFDRGTLQVPTAARAASQIGRSAAVGRLKGSIYKRQISFDSAELFLSGPESYGASSLSPDAHG